MGLMFQHFELLPMLNGYDNIRVPLLIGRSISTQNNQDISHTENFCKRVDELVLCIRPDLDFLRKRVTQISGGQKQVINIIRALIYNPLLLIGDEVTSGLDVEFSHNTYKLLKHSIQENDSVGIFISHDHIISEYCNRIFTMEDGRLVEEMHA